MENAIDKAYRVYRWFLDNVIANIAAVVMLAATCLALSEIVRRYILGVVFQWGQDAVTFGLVASLFLYFAVTQGRRSHLTVEAVTDIFRRRNMMKTILFLRSVVSLISLSLFGVLAWWGVPTIERSMMMQRKTESLFLLIWPFQAALALGFAMMAIGCLFQFYQDVQAVRGREVFKWAPVEEGIEI